MPKEENLSSYLRKEISKTGFPLEIEISSVLDKDWMVYNNDPYVDEDEEKTREIDIYAIHTSSIFSENELKRRDIFIVTSNLIVECKKATTHAWIFFTRPRPFDWVPGPPDGHTFDFLEAFSNGKQSFLEPLRLPKTHYDRFPRVAYNYVEAKLQKDVRSESSSIFEAQNQLWKCLSYNSKIWREMFEKDRSSRAITVFFPAIVLDGELFEATGPSANVRLTRSHHVLLSISRRAKPLGPSMKDFLIDVVRKENFGDYMKMVKSDIVLIKKYFSTNRARLAKEADEAVERLP